MVTAYKFIGLLNKLFILQDGILKLHSLYLNCSTQSAPGVCYDIQSLVYLGVHILVEIQFSLFSAALTNPGGKQKSENIGVAPIMP